MYSILFFIFYCPSNCWLFKDYSGLRI